MTGYAKGTAAEKILTTLEGKYQDMVSGKKDCGRTFLDSTETSKNTPGVKAARDDFLLQLERAMDDYISRRPPSGKPSNIKEVECGSPIRPPKKN